MQLPDPEQFQFKDCVIGGDECLLIIPNHIGTKWNSDNERFRSIIVRKSDHHVLSHGLKKFTNFFETPDFQPWNNSWKFKAYHKLDGSCAIISKYKGEIIFRTRGTIDARQLPNGHEVDFLIKKYPLVFDNEHINKENITIIAEWCTPTNIICLREFPVPTLVLLNVIKNDTGEYESQEYLDYLGKLWDIPRPKKYEYSSISECIADVEAWKGKEGVVVFSPDYQTLKKIKSSQYLSLHKIATGIKSISNVLDVFMESPRYSKYEDFYNYVETTLDHEIAERIKDDIKLITEAYDKFLYIEDNIKKYMNKNVRFLETRKEQAIQIQNQWKEWSGLAFTILDNKDVDDKLVKKSLEKILKI